jgi:hypothetical protein
MPSFVQIPPAVLHAILRQVKALKSVAKALA